MFFYGKSINAKLLAYAAVISFYSQTTRAGNLDLMSGENFVVVKGGAVQSMKLSADFTSTDVDSGYVAGIEMGKKFMDHVALSIEYNYRSKTNATHNVTNAETYTWNVKSNSYMANIAIDLLKHKILTPYVKLGAGFSSNKTGDYVKKFTVDDNVDANTYPGKTKNCFTWQLGAGVNVAFNEQIALQAQYMYVDRGKITTQAYYYDLQNPGFQVSGLAKTGRLKDNLVTIGLRVKF